MGDDDGFVVWRPSSLISFDEYYVMRRSRKASDEPSIDQEGVVDSVTMKKKSVHPSRSFIASGSVTSKRRERRRSLQHLGSVEDSTKPPPPPPPSHSPRTPPNQRYRKKFVKQHSFAMKELVDLLESSSQSPATVLERKYRLTNGNA
jgi:hypothetical protein